MTMHLPLNKTNAPKDCPECSHRLGRHIGLGDPALGGIILCPQRGCQCYAKWTIPGVPSDEIPDLSRDLIEQLRERVQPTAEQERLRFYGRICSALIVMAVMACALMTGFLDFGTTPTPLAIVYLISVAVCIGGAWVTAMRLGTR